MHTAPDVLVACLCNLPCACSNLEVEVFERDADAFVGCTLEDIATIDVRRVRLWKARAAERARLTVGTAVHLLACVIYHNILAHVAKALIN